MSFDARQCKSLLAKGRILQACDYFNNQGALLLAKAALAWSC